MKNKNLFWVLIIFVIVSLACGKSKKEETPEAVFIPPTQQPTLEGATQPMDAPTLVPVMVTPFEDEEEEPIQQSGSPYYTEEFDVEKLNTWFPMITYGDEKSVGMFTKRGKLVFTIDATDTYAYLINEAYQYQDVVLDTQIENRGVNTNNVSLVCRLNDEGWYEYTIKNNGYYELWMFTNDDGYELLHKGGSKYIRTGQSINQYTVICEGNELTLYINGVDTHTQIDKTLRYEGMVGVAVSSTYAIPVEVEFDYFTVMEP